MPDLDQAGSLKVEVVIQEKDLANSNRTWDRASRDWVGEDVWLDLPSEEFDVVLLTCGFGPEMTSAVELDPATGKPVMDPATGMTVRSPFVGFGFWADDQYDDVGRHLPNGDEARVLIAGGGDGALQDYIRLTTRPDLRRAPWEFLDRTGGWPFLEIPDEVLSKLRMIEDHSQKSWLLHGRPPISPDKRPDHLSNSWIHERHHRLIAQLVADNETALEVIVREDHDLPTIHLVHWCQHFDNLYPMNRFLVLLISEYLRTRRYRDGERFETVFPGAAVKWIDCVGHDPGEEPPDERAEFCFGQEHEVTFAKASVCFSIDPGANPILPEDGIYNVIIMRYGIDPPDLTSGRTNLRQILPATPPF